MSASELLDLLLRWFHVIAGIMWIGNSLLFNWLDRNLVKKEGIDGEIWLLHSGAYYQIEKKLLEPGQMPDKVHWFMWQNLSTWASGILLLIVVYYVGESAWLVNPGEGHVAHTTAIAVGIGTLIAGWVFYDLLWRSPLRHRPILAGAICLAALVAVAWGLSEILAPRAAFIHVGVLLGTLMTGNVWMVIIPSQVELTAATKEGREQDRALSLRAKERSIHNNYMTFPLIFTMVSIHFPSAYGHHLNWAILFSLMIGGALVRHFMNIRFHFPYWRSAIIASASLALLVALALMDRPAPSAIDDPALAETEPVPFEEVQMILSERCATCHGETPSDPLFSAPPDGLTLERPAEIEHTARRIGIRVESETMPPANRTHMTDEERMKVMRWVAQGAPVN